jgi:tRNA-2-methylthio-N6-dimethylallyladenosine synthase
VPGVAITTDILCGFCDESEQDHLLTLDLMRVAAFDASFMFKYSVRPGTVAEKRLEDNVPDDVKSRRLNEIIALQNELSRQSNKRDVGQCFEVLVEGTSKKNDDELYGRTPQNKVVVFPRGEYKTGDLVTVKITRSTQATLFGQTC